MKKTIFIFIFLLISIIFIYAIEVTPPKIDPGSGQYKGNITVTIYPTTKSNIKYTIDGTTPTFKYGIDYKEPIVISKSCVLIAVSYIYVDGRYLMSEITSAKYEIVTDEKTTLTESKVLPPKIDPGGGQYKEAVKVAIYPASKSMIKFTIDGTTPTVKNGIDYKEPIIIPKSCTLMAVAYAYIDGRYVMSEISSAKYEILSDGKTEITLTQVSPPVIKPDSMKTDEFVNVEITCSTLNALIYYTLDGTTPTSSNGTLYTEPFILDKSTTVKAVAILPTVDQIKILDAKDEPFINSTVTTVEYEINLVVVENPIISPAGGVFDHEVPVTITCSTYGSDIYYTLDGTSPDAQRKILYTGPVSVNKSATLKVIAISKKAGSTPSKIIDNSYTILPTHSIYYVEEYYTGGALKNSYAYYNGKKHFRYFRFLENGDLDHSYFYWEDKKNSVAFRVDPEFESGMGDVLYYIDDVMQSDSNAANMKNRFKFETYYNEGEIPYKEINGRIKIEHNGSLIWTDAIYEYYSAYPGRLKSITPIMNGKREGIGKEFYPSGHIKKLIPYVNNSIIGYVEEFNESGVKISSVYHEPWPKLINYVRTDGDNYYYNTSFIDHAEKGLKYRYDSNDKLLKLRLNDNGYTQVLQGYTNDVLTSIIYYNEEGDEIFEAYGEEIAIHKIIDNHGFMWWEIPHINGIANGIGIQYHEESDAIYQFVPFLNGKIHGTVFSFNESGDKVTSIEKYENGVKVDVEGNPIGNFSNFDPDIRTEYHYYLNTKLKSIIRYYDGDLNGLIEIYADTGNPISKISYQDNIAAGYYEIYYDNGILKEKGETVFYYDSKTASYQTAYKGFLYKYNDLGDLVSQTEYKENIDGDNVLGKGKNGVEKIYEGGVLKSETNYYINKKNGVEKIYDSTGTVVIEEKNYIDGSLSGSVTIRHNNGETKMVIPTLRGNYHGDAKVYDESGVLIKIINYIEGYKVSEYQCMEYDPATILKNGEMIYYGAGGIIKKIQHYSNDKLSGAEYIYDESGEYIIRENNYESGKISGTQKTFYPKSEIIKIEQQYLQYKLWKESFYSPDQKLVKKISYGTKEGHYTIYLYDNLEREIKKDTYLDYALIDYTITEYKTYPDGTKKSYTAYKWDPDNPGKKIIRDIQKFYFSNGEIAEIIPYCPYSRDGTLNGDHEIYYAASETPDGVRRLKLKTTYNYDFLESTIEYYPDGTQKKDITYEYEKNKIKYIDLYDETGTRILKYSYTENVKTKETKYIYGTNNRLYDAAIVNDMWNGTYTEYFEDGSYVTKIAAQYVDDKLHGMYKKKSRNNPGLILEEANYVNNLKHGYYVSYYDQPDPNHFKMEEGYYENNEKEGEWKTWDSSGNEILPRISYNGGVREVGAPNFLDLEAVDNNTIQLNWDSVITATGYKIKRSTSLNGTYNVITNINQYNTTNYIDSACSADTTYYYKVIAFADTVEAAAVTGSCKSYQDPDIFTDEYMWSTSHKAGMVQNLQKFRLFGFRGRTDIWHWVLEGGLLDLHYSKNHEVNGVTDIGIRSTNFSSSSIRTRLDELLENLDLKLKTSRLMFRKVPKLDSNFDKVYDANGDLQFESSDNALSKLYTTSYRWGEHDNGWRAAAYPWCGRITYWVIESEPVALVKNKETCTLTDDRGDNFFYLTDKSGNLPEIALSKDYPTTVNINIKTSLLSPKSRTAALKYTVYSDTNYADDSNYHIIQSVAYGVYINNDTYSFTIKLPEVSVSKDYPIYISPILVDRGENLALSGQPEISLFKVSQDKPSYYVIVKSDKGSKLKGISEYVTETRLAGYSQSTLKNITSDSTVKAYILDLTDIIDTKQLYYTVGWQIDWEHPLNTFFKRDTHLTAIRDEQKVIINTKIDEFLTYANSSMVNAVLIKYDNTDIMSLAQELLFEKIPDNWKQYIDGEESLDLDPDTQLLASMNIGFQINTIHFADMDSIIAINGENSGFNMVQKLARTNPDTTVSNVYYLKLLEKEESGGTTKNIDINLPTQIANQISDTLDLIPYESVPYLDKLAILDSGASIIQSGDRLITMWKDPDSDKVELTIETIKEGFEIAENAMSMAGLEDTKFMSKFAYVKAAVGFLDTGLAMYKMYDAMQSGNKNDMLKYGQQAISSSVNSAIAVLEVAFPVVQYATRAWDETVKIMDAFYPGTEQEKALARAAMKDMGTMAAFTAAYLSMGITDEIIGEAQKVMEDTADYIIDTYDGIIYLVPEDL